jgi:LacI family transcriptional regulator
MPHLTNVRRKEAFESSMRAIGFPPEQAPVCIDEHTFEGGTRAAEHFLRIRPAPTAIICSNDLMAVGVLRVLSERGILVPQQISVVGFDDIHLAEFANPPLSTIRMSREELASSAFHALERLADGGLSYTSPPTQISTRLILRQSTGVPPASPSVAKRRRKVNTGV